MQSEYQPTEAEKALQVALMLLEQGNVSAAEPILKSVLASAGDQSMVGAMCLTSLSQIYEQRGDMRAAIDTSMRILKNRQDYQQMPSSMHAVYAERTAQLLTFVGDAKNAQQYRQMADDLMSDRSDSDVAPAVGHPQKGPGASEWLMQNLYSSVSKLTYNKSAIPSLSQSQESESSKFDETADNSPRSRAKPQRPAGKQGGAGENEKPSDRGVQYVDDERGFDINDALFSVGTMGKGVVPKSDKQEPAGRGVTKPSGARKKSTRKNEREESKPQAVAKNAKRMVAKPAKRVKRPSNSDDGPSLFEKMGEWMGGNDDAKFSQPQKIENQRAETKVLSLIGSFVIVGLLFAAAWNIIPRVGNADFEFQSMPHKFQDAAQTKYMFLINKKECELVAGPVTQKLKLNFYFGDWRDMVCLSFGQLLDKFNVMERDRFGLRDRDGTLLYSADGPEIELVKRIDLMTADLNNHYQQTNHYPSKIADLKGTNWTFKNPFSKEKEDPTIVTKSFGSETDQEATDKARQKFYDELSSGKFWQDKYEPHSGGIACCSALFKSARGNISTFVITALGRDGEPLTGPVPDSRFFAASEDGRTRKEPVSKLPEATGLWIAVKPIDSQFYFWLKEVPGIVFAIFTLISLGTTLSLSKRDSTRNLWVFITAVNWIVAGLYIGFTHLRK